MFHDSPPGLPLHLFPTFMVDTTSPTLYLLKAENSEVFGPVDFEQLTTWATAAQVSPLDKISSDQQTWFKAPMVPELGMDYLIELTSEQLYGPTTLGAIQEFINLGEVHGDTNIINAKDGSSDLVRDIPALVLPGNEPAEPAEPVGHPLRTGIRASLQQRIRELEHTLIEERRALDTLEERYEKLEAAYAELSKQRSA